MAEAAARAADPAQPRQSLRFLILYALAWAGGAAAYVPFLTLLLPLRMTTLFGSADIHWLAIAAFCGALAASGGNILFGWLSDLSGRRRPWIAAGLAITLTMYFVILHLDSPAALIAGVILWQLGLNMMLGPLGAWAGDCVPDGQKGTLGGLMALAPATGALAGAVVTTPGLAGPDGRMAIVALMVAAAILPALLFGRPRPMPQLRPDADPADAGEAQVGSILPRERRARRAMIVMWLARLAVQIAEATLFAYLLFYFRSIDPTVRDADTARVFSAALAASVPVALLVGRWADRTRRPLLPLAACTALSGTGLTIMALSGGLGGALFGYVVFGLSTTVFLSLHSGQTLRVLPRPRRRGRDLGLFNLTNTVPSLIMPWLALGIVPGFGYAPLMAVLAALAFSACALLASLRRLP